MGVASTVVTTLVSGSTTVPIIANATCGSIGQYHYFITSFWLSVWIPVDWFIPVYHFGVFFVLALFQRVFFVAGGTICDSDLYWGWSFLSTTLGIAIGYALQAIIVPPILLSRKPGFEANVFVKAPILTAAFVGAQLFYGKMPPRNDTPWGVILSAFLTSLIVAATWAWSYDDPTSRTPSNRSRSYTFFIWWIILTASAHAWFLLGYTSISDQFVALIAFGGTMGVLLASTLLLPRFCCARRKSTDYTSDYREPPGIINSEVTYTSA